MRTFSSACRCFCTNGSIWPCRNLAACHGAPDGTAPGCECSLSQLRTQLGRYPPRMRPICTLKAPPHIVGILLLRQRNECGYLPAVSLSLATCVPRAMRASVRTVDRM